MIVPAAMNIESVADQKPIPDWVAKNQLKELYSAVGEKSEDFKAGYQLGLQTARVVVGSSVALLLAKVNPEDVL